MEWKKIAMNTYRMDVPGGWLILHKSRLETYKPIQGVREVATTCESMVFVPFPTTPYHPQCWPKGWQEGGCNMEK